MSNTTSLGVVRNYTLATPLNKTTQTETVLHLISTLSTSIENSSWIPFNDTIWNPNFNSSIDLGPYGNNSNYWNYSIWDPNCVDCYPGVVTVNTPIITYSYTYAYIYYVLLLLLLVVAVVCIKIGISRRNQLERRAAAIRRRARQQAENPYNTTNNDNNANNDNSSNMGPKEFDLPPTYEEVAKNYLMANQQQQRPQQNLNEGASGSTANPSALSSNNISTAVSTLTIESEIDSSSNLTIAIDLNNSSTSGTISETNVISSAVVNSLSPPPPYDLSMSNAKTDNDHIV